MEVSRSFPVELNASSAELEERYQPVRFVATSDAGYHFVTAVPRQWQVVRAETSPPDQNRPVQTLLLAQAQDGSESEIEIFSSLIEREMHPSDWAQVVLESRGHKILAQRRLPTDFGDAGDFLTETEDNRGTIVSRVFAIKDYNRLFIIHGRSRSQAYAADAVDYLCSIQATRLLQPTALICAEPLKEFHIAVPMLCQFRVPQKWERRPAPATAGGVSFQLHDIERERVTGAMQATTLPLQEADNPAALCDQYLDQLGGRGYAVGVRDTHEPAPPEGFQGAIVYRIAGTRNEAAMDGKCAVLSHGAGWFILASLGVGPETHRELWSIHDRAFAIALQTLAAGGATAES